MVGTQEKTRTITAPVKSEEDFLRFYLRLFSSWTRLTRREEDVLVKFIELTKNNEGLITSQHKKTVQSTLDISNVAVYIKAFKDKELIYKPNGDNKYAIKPHLRPRWGEFEQLVFKFPSNGLQQE